MVTKSTSLGGILPVLEEAVEPCFTNETHVAKGSVVAGDVSAMGFRQMLSSLWNLWMLGAPERARLDPDLNAAQKMGRYEHHSGVSDGLFLWLLTIKRVLYGILTMVDIGYHW